ncbi:MAG: prepilin peptidase [Lachnospiraceae bacterium]|nr:prepilin peptidase [Lachnospiraceae bacterium]MBO6299518.1 prepilin peptidase [Lachnospiraceae bacterium]
MGNRILGSREIWTGIALLLGSVMDWKTQRLPVWFMAVFGAGSLVLIAVQYPGDWQQKGIGILLGGSLLLVGKLSGCIGVADGVMVMIMGLLYGGAGCGEQLLIAVLLTAVIAVILIGSRRADAKTRIPFVPFLAAGFLGYLII